MVEPPLPRPTTTSSCLSVSRSATASVRTSPPPNGLRVHTTLPKRSYTVTWSELRPTIVSSVPSPLRSATATPGHTRFPLGPRHCNAPVPPFRLTVSYEPHTTSGWPSPLRSATAGDEYHPVWQKDAKQPPRCHFRTGAPNEGVRGASGPGGSGRPAAGWPSSKAGTAATIAQRVALFIERF